jgi:hypothetical protein
MRRIPYLAHAQAVVRSTRLAAAMLSLAATLLVLSSGHAQAGWQWYMTDPHVHSSVSADAIVDVGIIAQEAKAAGYDAIFLTDHASASSFHINNQTANSFKFEDAYTRWTVAAYGSPAATANELVATPVNSGSASLHLKSTGKAGSVYGETMTHAFRGPTLRSGDVFIDVAIYPTRIDANSGIYVSASLGGDTTVFKTPVGYTTANANGTANTPSPGKSVVFIWQLGNPRAASNATNARVVTHSLNYTLNQWNVYSINVSDAIEALPAADRPLDYNGLVHLKIAAGASNGATAEGYVDSYNARVSSPRTRGEEIAYRNTRVGEFNTASFKVFPSAELG